MALYFALRSSCRNSAPIFASVLNGGKVLSVNRPLTSMSRSLLATKPTATTFGVTALRKISINPIPQGPVKGNHVTLWNAERALATAMLGVLPVGLMFPSQAGDALMAVCIVMHQYWGLEAIVTDYVRPILFGNTVPKIAHGLLLAISAAMLGGLFYFIHNDIGIANTIRKIWSTKPKA